MFSIREYTCFYKGLDPLDTQIKFLLLLLLLFDKKIIIFDRRRRADEPRLKTNEMHPLRAVNRAYNRTLTVDGASQESSPTEVESGLSTLF